MTKVSNEPAATVKIYHGYGHKDNLILYGHVLAGKPAIRIEYSNNPITNIIHLVRLFFIHPVPGARVRLQWDNRQFYSTTANDGFFKFKWQSENPIPAGWHPVTVHLLNAEGTISATGEGKIFIPHSTQYAFISDIDDTILVSYAATTYKRLKTLFTRNPRTRKTFVDVVRHYGLLSLAHTDLLLPNPFFYVSSSEWNLYDDLDDFFTHNGLPDGIFLLNKIKRWYQLLKSGKTKHEAKLLRVTEILEAFPRQLFILLGDNTQSDPEIYASIANKFPDKIVAVYIRNINLKNELKTKEILNSVQNKDIHTCLFEHTNEAILYSKSIGLID